MKFILITFGTLCLAYGCLGAYAPEYKYEAPIKRPDILPIQPNRVVQAALQTKHTIRYVNVDLPYEEREPQIIEVNANPLPIIMHFKSASSRIRVQQSHTGLGSGQIQETKSEDQPQRLRHEVIKPIIQEVKEIVLPYRKVVQEIRPVIEEIQTVVAKKSDDKLDNSKESGAGGISGSVQFGSGIKGSGGVVTGSVDGSGTGYTGVSGNVKRSARYSNYNNYDQRY